MSIDPNRFERYRFRTVAEQMAVFRAERARCPICGDPATDIDHDHSTGAVRGHLCRACNVGLGHFGDDPLRLKAAVEYLDHHALTGEPVEPDWSQTRGTIAAVVRLLKSTTPEDAAEEWGEEAAMEIQRELMRWIQVWDEQDREPVVFS